MFVLDLLLLAGGVCLVSASDVVPDAQITLAPSETPAAEVPEVVSSYKAIFSKWNIEEKWLGDRPIPRCLGCGCCHHCCSAGVLLAVPTTFETATDSTTHLGPTPAPSAQDRLGNENSISIGSADIAQTTTQAHADCYMFPECCAHDDNIPTPSAVFPPVATDAPTRTTIYRHGLQTAASKPPGTDVTDTYYSFSLEGQHPNVIPLIIENASDEPLTLLAYGNASSRINLIAASLITQLNLTRFLDEASQDSAAAQVVAGPDARSLGTINLNILAGRNDRKFPSVPFNVFEGEIATAYQEDVIVGLDFLNSGGALRLSDEYVGVGARRGLGVVVQRVLMPDVNHKGDKAAKMQIGQGIVHEEL